MKKIQTLAGLLALCVTLSLGCARSGSGNLPEVVSVSPTEGRSDETVLLTLENFDEKKDIVLFGGVPVKLLDSVESTDGSPAASVDPYEGHLFRDALIKRQVSPPTGAVPSLKKSVTGAILIPKGLSAGDIQITTRRKDFESDGVGFTILGSTVSEGDGKDAVDAPGDEGGESADEEVVTPPPPEADAGDDAGSDGDAGSEGTPNDGEDFHPEAVVALVDGGYSYGWNYQNIRWSASYVDAAFLRVPVNSHFGALYYHQFQGSKANPFPYSVQTGELGLLEKLAQSVFATDHGALPFNYCLVPGKNRVVTSTELCYTANPNLTGTNYIDIAIPLSKDSVTKEGIWKFQLPYGTNVFTIYYRDWTKTLKKKDLKIAAPGYGC